MSTIRSRITGRPEHHGARQRAHVGQAGQAVLAIDVHRVGAANALAAGAAEAQSRVHRLELVQRIEQHALAAIKLDVDRLHARLGIGVGVVAVDLEHTLSHG
jgi:hypothetical protein